ncbi:MAG TPA: von Willebrand factor type A domain-containing protein, partial [Chitinophagaceae bacterium]|nr:von Willebrand factor type A domain-containing protein [Chitinophagaceae bacterium]
MKAGCYILLFSIICLSGYGQQFYIRGEVKDEEGNALQNVKILQHRTGYVYRSGVYGSFGIVTNFQTDTLSFSLDGYGAQDIFVNADNYIKVKLKLLPASGAITHRNKLASLTKDLAREDQKKWFTGDETYASLVENHFVSAKKFRITGMSLDIDKASYSNIRRFINLNTIVPPDAVRIEEMLNYFNLSYNEPEGQNIFKINTTLTSCPWNSDNELFYINLSSRKINIDSLPPSNLVFLIDISGSMDMPNRLPLLQSAFKLLVNNLRAKDTVSIVVYGGEIGVKLDATSGAEKEKILKVIDGLTPGGSTPGESGIKLAYSMAHLHFIKGGNNRIILATDGDFNVGAKTEDDLGKLVALHRQSGIYLTCLGVGMGNYKDSKIQTLAQKGNGNFAYLDNFQEAEKVLLTELTQTLYAVADNVYMNVEFNPEYVKEYRLIGFNNKVSALSDTTSAIDGGEIGSGNSLIAVFEISPTEANEKAVTENFMSGKFADIKVQYRQPEDTVDREFLYPSRFDYIPFAEVDKCYQFSAAVVMF